MRPVESDKKNNVRVGSEEPEENEPTGSIASTETDPLLSEKSADIFCWLRSLRDSFGYKLLYMLFVVQHCQKGFANTWTDQAEPYLYKTYNVPAPSVQIYSSVTMLPWAMKPIIGLVSDVLPLAGYKKAPYMLSTSLACAGACLALALLPQPALPIISVVVCLVLLNLQFSTCDLLSEAKYAEKIRHAPDRGPALLTFVWFGLQVGGLAAALTSGWAIHAFGPKIPYAVVAVPALAVTVPVAMGFMEEQWCSPEEVRAIRQRYWQQGEACVLCFLMLGSGVTLALCGIFFHNPLVNGIAAMVVAVVVLTGFSLVLSPVIAKFNAFSLIQGALSLSTRGASFYFYTDTPEQYPEGPHFSEFFYNSVMGTLGSVCSLVGIFCYQRYMSTWKYRNLIIATNIMVSLLHLVDVMMFARINVKIGIPDHAFVLGGSMLQSVIGQWQWMPQVVILSYLCPKGMEATMYALLAGCHNMGNTIASNAGALLLRELGVQPRGEPGESRQFELLWVAATVSTILPLVAILVLYKLIPDARQNERIVDAAHDATSGSIWRRWFPRED
mmetsp:Transcript_41375/g.115018  ORF Transcript_41375/g.115018 Transcript_41375/m.115018 type:complete len:556 (-) Transcript_41375:219-1886(-)